MACRKPWRGTSRKKMASCQYPVASRKHIGYDLLTNVYRIRTTDYGPRTTPMPSHFYAPTKQDKFAFGIWCLQNRGRDPFGDQTRPELPALECIRGLAKRNCYGFEFHDNDIMPFGASAAQRDQIL